MSNKTTAVVTTEETNVTIKNATLRKNVNAFKACNTKIFAEQWKAVKVLAVMFDEEQWTDDFKSERAFAKYLGMPQSTVNKSRRAAQIADECIANGVSVSKAYELLTLPTESAECLLECAGEMTQKDLRKAVKSMKEPMSKGEEVATEIEDDEQELCYILPFYDMKKGEVVQKEVTFNGPEDVRAFAEEVAEYFANSSVAKIKKF